MSAYSVEQIDEDTITEFIQSHGCRRQVLGRHIDGDPDRSSCSQMDGVFCDRCRVYSRARGPIREESQAEPGTATIEESAAITGAVII